MRAAASTAVLDCGWHKSEVDEIDYQHIVGVPVEKKNTESAMKHAGTNVRNNVALLNSVRGESGSGKGGELRL